MPDERESVGLSSEVATALDAAGAPASATALWDEVHVAYREGGPEAVRDLIEKKVRSIQKAANAEVSEMKAAAGAVRRRGRPKRR